MIEGHEGQDPSARARNGSAPLDTELTNAAAGGSEEAWNAIVDRFAPEVWSIARRRHLSRSRSAEVCHLTWIRLVDHLPSIPPGGLLDWLQATAERECSRLNGLHLAEMDGLL